MADIKYDIIKEIGVLSENAKGWRKELNLISWNGGAAKYDIRDWAPDHEKMGKGTTLTEDRTGNRSVCLTGISKEESRAGKMEKTVVFRGRDESSQCFVYSFVSGQKSPFYHMRLYCMVCIFGIFCQAYKE